MWDLIVSVPDHCLSFYFAQYTVAYYIYQRAQYTVAYYIYQRAQYTVAYYIYQRASENYYLVHFHEKEKTVEF